MYKEAYNKMMGLRKEALKADPTKLFKPLKLALASLLGNDKKHQHQANRLYNIYRGSKYFGRQPRPERLQKLRQVFAASEKYDPVNIFANVARAMGPDKKPSIRPGKSWLDPYIDSIPAGRDLTPSEFQKQFSKIFNKLPENTKKVIEANTKYKDSL